MQFVQQISGKPSAGYFFATNCSQKDSGIPHAYLTNRQKTFDILILCQYNAYICTAINQELMENSKKTI